MNLSPHFTFDELTRTSQTALQVKNRAEAQAFLPSLTELAALLEVPDWRRPDFESWLEQAAALAG